MKAYMHFCESAGFRLGLGLARAMTSTESLTLN